MNQTTSKEEKLKNLIRQVVIETLEEVLKDPDFGLELQNWVKERFKRHPKNSFPLRKLRKNNGL